MLSYEACCGRFHAGPLHLMAPDAPALMRSRYSAFVLDRLDYLLATWHPHTRPPSLEPNPQGIQWMSLEVQRHTAQGDSAQVEFTARHKFGGRLRKLHETSRFVREEGRWFYLDGDVD